MLNLHTIQRGIYESLKQQIGEEVYLAMPHEPLPINYVHINKVRILHSSHSLPHLVSVELQVASAQTSITDCLQLLNKITELYHKQQFYFAGYYAIPNGLLEFSISPPDAGPWLGQLLCQFWLEVIQ